MESSQSDLKARIVAAAKAMISGDIDLITGAREIEKCRLRLDDPDDPIFLPIIGFESQTDDYPMGDDKRALWAPEWLEAIDRRIASFVAKETPGVLEDLEELIRKFGSEL